MERLSGGADVGAGTRGVAGGTVAGMGAEQSKTGTSGFQNRNLRVLGRKTGTSGLQTRNLRVLGKTDSLLERPKLKFSYNNLKFGQNKSCRGREDLQLCFWAKVDLKLGSERKWGRTWLKRCLPQELD